MLLPWQTVEGPLIEPAGLLTVTVAEEATVPQALVAE
jgi:hypothetical protein